MHAFADKAQPLQHKASSRLKASEMAEHAVSHDTRPAVHLQRMAAHQSEKRNSANHKATTATRSARGFSQKPRPAKSSKKIQLKLKVNTPGDIHEQEADRIADHVMRISEPKVRRTCPCGGGCPQCQQAKDNVIQLKPGYIQPNDAVEAVAPSVVDDVIRTNGQPLDTNTREFMERRFGYDLSSVRVHTGGAASESARSMNALAYTVGSDIVFNS